MNSQSSYRQNGSQTCPSEQDSGRLSARTSEQGLRMNEDVQNFGSEGVGESG
jgi:hypothetical protein